MTRRERVLAALAGERMDRVPFALCPVFWGTPTYGRGWDRSVLRFWYRFQPDVLIVPPLRESARDTVVKRAASLRVISEAFFTDAPVLVEAVTLPWEDATGVGQVREALTGERLPVRWLEELNVSEADSETVMGGLRVDGFAGMTPEAVAVQVETVCAATEGLKLIFAPGGVVPPGVPVRNIAAIGETLHRLSC